MPYLKIKLEYNEFRIACTRCSATHPIEIRFPFSKKTWQQPWFPDPAGPELEEPAWVLEINDVRVHSADTPTALIIPPESRIRRGTVVDRLFTNTHLLKEIRAARPGLHRKTTLNRISRDLRCRREDVEDAITKIDEGYPLYDESIPDGNLLLSEYRALTGKIPDLLEDEDFVTEHHTAAWSAAQSRREGVSGRFAQVVDRLIAVKRLKEIMVFKGFRRCGGETVTPPDLTGRSDWLPALELYGEGIFFTLRESMVRRWEAHDHVRQRTETFLGRFHGASLHLPNPPQISPRFLLLHTLAHLMIRQLETYAGYPAASIKERIYSYGESEPDISPMAGILIYVAVPDTEGSLGGLMQQAHPDAFLRLLTAAIDAAGWCSFDPACREQDGHGPHLLNRAGCHACALVPEPSCAFGNVLLDRTFVTSGADGRLGLFDEPSVHEEAIDTQHCDDEP